MTFCPICGAVLRDNTGLLVHQDPRCLEVMSSWLKDMLVYAASNFNTPGERFITDTIDNWHEGQRIPYQNFAQLRQAALSQHFKPHKQKCTDCGRLITVLDDGKLAVHMLPDKPTEWCPSIQYLNRAKNIHKS